VARWITIIKAPFDYRWPDRSAITAFSETGEHMVKDEIADFAVRSGYAIEGKADPSVRSTKGKRPRRRARTAANAKPGASVGDADAPRARRSSHRASVAGDAGKR
jgi:hypothetical protein